MKIFAEVISHELTNAIGWTLLHSLWQSLVILVLIIACLRLIPAMRSSARYAVAGCGLILFLGVSIVTFSIEYTPSQTEHIRVDTSLIIHTGVRQASENGLLPTVADAIQTRMPIIVGLWAIGFLFFSVRLASGFIYSQRLKTSSIPFDHGWQLFVKQASEKLKINRLISLAESALIKSPIVIGYFKPVILIPVGMLSGLTAEQVETIFWHELAHIRRHDYVVNLVQSLVETIFFFNPGVHMLSNEIRKEREFCCDDVVLQHHGGSRAYALALTHLAEAKLAQTGFALALADNNNQLFKRIKRIMERSGNNGAWKARSMAPVIVLFAALLCISWLGTDNEGAQENSQQTLQNDTIPTERKSNSARYSRKTIITLDANGKPHEEIIEEFEGDERLKPLLRQGEPDFPGAILPPAPFGDPMSPLRIDTIPPPPFNDMKGWEEFSRSFEETFKSNFENFYGFSPADTLFFDFGDDFPYPDAEAFKELQEQMDQLQSEHFRDFGDGFNFHYEQLGGYETKLRDELIKDGYLSDGEVINSLEWNDDSFKVNGKAISPNHRKKYKELNDEFFGHTERTTSNTQ